jgi:hypothetical protein
MSPSKRIAQIAPVMYVGSVVYVVFGQSLPIHLLNKNIECAIMTELNS